MKSPLVLVLSFFGLLILTSCTAPNGQNGNLLPGIDLSEKTFNSKIVLENFPGEPSSYKVGDSLAFALLNRSSHAITFHNDFDVKIFKKLDTEWEPIDNNVDYPEGDRILPTRKIDPTGLVVFAIPDVGEIKAPTIVRIVVVGQVKDESEQVAAYIDVQYSP